MKTQTKPASQFAAFAAACRQNTGASFLDSGSAYGRHHERAPITEDSPAVTLDVYEPSHEVSATIETAHFLDAAFTHDAKLQARFNRWAAKQEGSWFELGERYCTEVLKLTQHARDNVYNGENDLSQVFVWEVYSPNEEESDWVYADEPLTLIYVHTGCDVRGGYGAPLFCRSKGEYATATDFVAGFAAIRGTDADGNELDLDELQLLDERWQVGYSSHPSFMLGQSVEAIVAYTKGAQEVTVKLKTGETVTIQPVMPYFS